MMKRSMLATVLSMTLCATVSACAVDQPADESDPPVTSEQQQSVEACPASYGCILTAIRDGNSFLIDTCIAVLCQA